MNNTNEYKIGQLYTFSTGDKVLTGTLQRIVKMSGPCIPSDNPWEWAYHIEVTSNNLRDSGMYCVSMGAIKDTWES